MLIPRVGKSALLSLRLPLHSRGTETMNSTTASLSTTNTTITSTTAASTFAIFFTGLALIFVVGFAPLPQLHNAAHDTRHSTAFPCH